MVGATGKFHNKTIFNMLNCRVCLENDPELYPIYEFVGKKYLPAVIYNISGVKVLRKQEPEALICSNCRRAVLIAEEIILRCQESEQFIQSEKLKSKETPTVIPNDNAIDESNSSDTSIQKSESHRSASPATCPEEDTETFSEDKPKARRKKFKDSALRCDQCDYSCQTARGLVAHRKEIHKIDDDNIFPCQECEKRFPWKSALNRHIQNIHQRLPEDKKYLCTACGKTYISRKHLSEHQIQHHAPRRFRCVEPNCNQTFTRAFTLRRHFLTAHQNEPLYQCNDCDEYFKIYDHWKYHNKVVHNNEKRDFKVHRS